MKAFTYKGEVYLRCVPSKNLFRSTMVHEVVNRGDIFALHVDSQELRIIPGKSEVEHFEGSLVEVDPPEHVHAKPARRPGAVPQKAIDALKQMSLDLAAPKFAIGERVRLRWWSPTSAVHVQARTELQKGEWVYNLAGLGANSYAEADLVKATK